MAIDRTMLAHQASGIGEHYSRMFLDERTEVTRLETPFLSGAEIYRATYKLPSKPVGFVIGTTETGRAYALSGAPEQFHELIRASILRLDTDVRRRSFVLVYLEATRSIESYFEIISGAADVHLKPNADGEARRRHAQILSDYSEVIHPLDIRSKPVGWSATLFAIRNRDLVRLDMRFSFEGDIDVSESILEEAMPVPYRI